MKTNMDMKLYYNMANKKALSTVIATVLLILLVTASTAVVWVFVNNIVTERTAGVQSCFELESSEKVTLNEYYTCYRNTTVQPGFEEVQFSINIGDAEIDKLIVLIAVDGNSKSFTLTNDNGVITNLKPYKGLSGDPVSLPGKNEGKTYVAEGFIDSENVDSIKISPVVENKQCGASDTIYEVEDCILLVG